VGGAISALIAALFAFSANVFEVQERVCAAPGLQPGLSDVCGGWGLGGRPTREYRLAFDALQKALVLPPDWRHHDAAKPDTFTIKPRFGSSGRGRVDGRRLLHALPALSRLRERGGVVVEPWLHRVAVNACLDRLRKRRFVGEDAAPERVDAAPLADAAIESDQLRDAVVRCVAALADRQRAAIVLTYYEGLSNIMAADALEMNIKAFESLLHRARRTLEESLRRTGIVDAGGETLA
jgi:RNA polymerase sigma factor (sigma-70 family)